MKETSAVGSSNSWRSIITQYNKPRISRSVVQIINSLGSYLALWVVMVLTMEISFWLTLPIMIVSAGFLIRIFIIFHDCGHGSFFKEKRLNVMFGKFFGILALTPYHRWTDNHRTHHQTVGNLDKRGLGDIWTLTVEEYQDSGRWKKFLYRLFRNPIFLFLFGGPLGFIIVNRFTSGVMTKKQKKNIYFTNVIIFLLVTPVSLIIGWQTFLLIQLPIVYFAAIGGVYLFYLQHQYDDVYWCRTEVWDYKEMALKGSSFLKLPTVLRWFTGNIGFHHVHHLGPTIPNYNLVKCYKENPIFQQVKSISFFRSFHSLKLRLWDEANNRIVTFREIKVRT